MNRWFKKLQHCIEYASLRFAVIFVWMMSLPAALRFADGLGCLVFDVLRIRRRVVLDQMRFALPDLSESERVDTARRAYQNFARMTIEYIRFPVMKHHEIMSLCSLYGREHMDWAMAQGKGAVMVAGHFGNWELMGAYLAALGYPIYFLVGEQHNKRVDDMMNAHREHMGIGIIHMGVAVRGVIRALRAGHFVALLSDQDAGTEGVFVDFFGKKASTHQGAAVFALKTGAPILFGSAIRRKNGRHRFVIERLTFDHLEGIRPENIYEATQAYTSLLEKTIRRNPDHWFWMHRRWKRRPPEEADTSTSVL